MKKLLFFLFATILFASCNNTDDTETTGKTYKVIFNVANFTSESTILKTGPISEWPTGNYCQYAIYKSSGELVKTNVMEAGTFDLSNVQISEELPEGNYWIAIFSAEIHANGILVLPNPSNFNTDYCIGNSWVAKGKDNQNVYYEKLNFAVGSVSGTTEVSIQLKPMWSELDIEVADADSCSLPEGTTHVQCVIDPYYYGFNLKDGVSAQSYEGVATSVGVGSFWSTVAEFRADKGIFDKDISGSQDVNVKLVYIKHSESEACTVLGEKVIYTGDIEKGKYITFSGSLGNDYSNPVFNLSLGELADGGIIPFE